MNIYRKFQNILSQFRVIIWNAFNAIVQILGISVLFVLGVLVCMYVVKSQNWQKDFGTPNTILAVDDDKGVERMKINSSYKPVVRPFIGIAMSGGGSRSANFSWAVAQELEGIGLLEHAEALSSVSGGSMAAAYMALNLKDKPDKKFWNDGYKVLGQDFIGDLRSKALNPVNFAKSVMSTYSRGDMWAEVLENKLVCYKTNRLLCKKTFAELPHGNALDGGNIKYRPSLFINATMVNDPLNFSSGLEPDPRLPMGDYMGNFTFSLERFKSMKSDLKTMPISYAVAASSAFPGAINPITLSLAEYERGGYESMGGKSRVIQPNYYAKRYAHLADGGLSDNLGTDTLRKVFETRNARQLDIDNKYIDRPCLIIAIDATAPPFSKPREDALSKDGRSTWWSPIIDATAVNGYDAYLLRRRADQLDELGVDSAGVDYGKKDKSRPTSFQVTDIKHKYTRYQERGGYASSPTVFVRSQQLDNSKVPLRNDIKSYQCSIWHIALEDIQVIRKSSSQNNIDRNAYLKTFNEATLGLATDLKLHSDQSPDCTTEQLQTMLRAAAKSLVHDKKPKSAVCEWMKNAKLDTRKCEVEDLSTVEIPTSCIRKSNTIWQSYLETEHAKSKPQTWQVN